MWIGDGFDPELDGAYSVYLEDQIERSKLGKCFSILPAVADIESAYLESDILFLSSRLDPLPLVSMDALLHGRPVVCFESTTGIAEYLAHDPLASFGVVPFLDVEAAACRICRLIDDRDFRLEVGAASRQVAKSRFSFQCYVEQLDKIGRQCAARKEQEKLDRAVISNSKFFDTSFFTCPLSPPNGRDPVKDYITAYSSGVRPRKGLPGFHPGIYSEHNDIGRRDPLAHYLDSGRPPGPWAFEVIRPKQDVHIANFLRVGLHLHVHYPEMLDEILALLQRIDTVMDILVSVTNPAKVEATRFSLSAYSRGKVEVKAFKNRGRDIGPFFTGFGETILNDYDVIGHVHTKKSASMSANVEAISKTWRRFLYANLLADEEVIADTILQQFGLDDSIGFVFPDEPRILGWGENLPFALELAERLSIAALPKTTFNFPVGTMFWARTTALKPLFELGLTWVDYPAEPLPYDGSLLHAIERILPFVVEKAGFRNVVTHVPGITR